MAYTNIDDPSAYFQIALYAGNGTGQTITNDGNSDLKPDFLWFKNRSETVSNILWDSTRGITKFLISNTTAAEFTNVSGYELTSFNTDGFGLGAHNNAGINQSSSYNYVSWQWKANGGTTASNSDGSITSTVQANQDAGFSIVTYTTAGSAATIGHGLGAKPDVILLKKRNGAIGWLVRHVSTGTSYLSLNSTMAAASNPGPTWTTTEPTTSVYSIGTSTDVNVNGGEYVAYCFASKQGYSKFGSYIANANTNGPFVYTGFKPAFLMIKNTNRVEPWMMYDNKRTPINQIDTVLQADSNGAETTAAADYGTDFLSNGFKIRAVGTGYANHTAGNKYIYMAFAENPFTTSTGIPTTAR